MALAAIALCLAVSPAHAHASERGYVLLLPTGYYIVGGAVAVAASFLGLVLVPPGALSRLFAWRLPLFSVPDGLRPWTSLAAFAVMVVLVLAGVFGSRDPLSNPLPLFVWTLLWVGLTIAHGAFGNLWEWLNPWSGLLALLKTLPVRFGAKTYPRWLGFWPALCLFAGFTWLELVYPAPDDPDRLARAVTAYWLLTFAGMLVYGEGWRRRAEFLTVFFTVVSRFAVVTAVSGRREADRRVALGLPGAALADEPALPLSGTLFVLAALATVSFDGFSGTFAWLGANGVNPLEPPGRTAMQVVNTAGLAAAFAVLSGAFLGCVVLGQRLVGSGGWKNAAGRLVWSIVPIALAYHFAHYLVAFAVDAQYALAALSDPFSRGWDLFGTAARPVSAGVVMGPEAARLLWNLQAGAIIGGHVLAVLIAHELAWRLHSSARQAVLSQLPLTGLMVGYTVFGLWLLSTPVAG